MDGRKSYYKPKRAEKPIRVVITDAEPDQETRKRDMFAFFIKLAVFTEPVIDKMRDDPAFEKLAQEIQEKWDREDAQKGAVQYDPLDPRDIYALPLNVRRAAYAEE